MVPNVLISYFFFLGGVVCRLKAFFLQGDGVILNSLGLVSLPYVDFCCF